MQCYLTKTLLIPNHNSSYFCSFCHSLLLMNIFVLVYLQTWYIANEVFYRFVSFTLLDYFSPSYTFVTNIRFVTRSTKFNFIMKFTHKTDVICKGFRVESKGKLKVLETSFLSFSYIYTPPLTNFDYKNLFLTRKYRLTARMSYHIIFHKSYTHKTDNTFKNDKYIQYS